MDSPLLTTLRHRAELLRRIRDFFHGRGVLEIETPVLSRGISLDCHIDVFSAGFHAGGYPVPAGAPGTPFYLQTSPEPHMKRLLCRGFPDMYQLSRCFRNGERGRRHNPEFTMLEWYRRGFGLDRLMEEVEKVCRLAEGGPFSSARPALYTTYVQVFQDALGVDPLAVDRETLLALPALAGKQVPARDLPTKPDVLDFLMAHVVEPGLPPDTLVFVRDFPAEQASQARLSETDPGLAHRFEVYGAGMELANGYVELSDPAEYRRRFLAENGKRRARGKPELPLDSRLFEDIERGLPPCAGVALGFDRLLMLGLGVEDIGDVLAFPWETC